MGFSFDRTALIYSLLNAYCCCCWLLLPPLCTNIIVGAASSSSAANAATSVIVYAYELSPLKYDRRTLSIQKRSPLRNIEHNRIHKKNKQQT